MGKDTKEQKKEATAAAKAAQPKTKRKSVDKWKKKAWYTLVAPEEFERKELGTTVAEKPELVLGRVVSVTAGELANQPKKGHIHLKFKASDINANKAHTQAVGHVIKDSYMKRVVRRRSSKIMLVREYSSKDKKTFKTKVVIVTERKASNRQKAAVLRKADEITGRFIGELDAKKVVEQLVFGNLPNRIYPEAKKIVPIKRIEVVKSFLL